MCDFVACTRLNDLVVLVYFDVKKVKLRNKVTVKRFLSFLYNVLEINDFPKYSNCPQSSTF